MKFLSVSIDEAKGQILGHNIAGNNGRRVLRKGRALSDVDIATLRELGRHAVYIAQLDSGDVDENLAAQRIADAVTGSGVRCSAAATGRVNIFAQDLGIVRVDTERLVALNSCAGVTLATMLSHTPARAGKMVATLKIIPYALPESTVQQAERLSTNEAGLLSAPTHLANGPTIWMTPLTPKRVGLILSGSVMARDRIVDSFKNALTPRLEALAATIEQIDFVPLDDETGEMQLADMLLRHMSAGVNLVILAGETAIMDRYDIAPRAVERAGGEITCFGAPVDPGNLLMLAYHGQTPIVGAPGCSRSPKDNIIDLVLPRLLAGDRLTDGDIIHLGHGGLLEDVPERPLPRSQIGNLL